MVENKKLTFHQILWYFIIFSTIGLLIETIFCYFTSGIVESRKGLLWGPFCPVYGVGAAILIILLNKVNTNNYFKLFIYGFLIGSLLEYIMSYVLEAVYSIRFWDYTYTGNSINGRICILYSLFWGILSIFLLKVAKPAIDKLIEKIPKSIEKKLDIFVTIFFILNAIVTVWAISTYENRATEIYNGTYNNTSPKNSIIKNIEEKHFTNERMKKTFPNLRIKDKDGKEIWIKTII
mgnify:FL=1